MSNYNDLNLTDYLGKSFPCNCGHTHSAPIRYISIGEKALNELPKLLYELHIHKAFLIYDTCTYEAAGTFVTSELNSSNISFINYVIPDREPVPNEKAIGELLIHYETDCDIVIAVGSGTINDLCRYFSYKLGLKYIIVITAPSVDGFASTVAPLIVNHMKTTYEAHAPYAIIGDTSILSKAPLEMISAGIGDILGKYTCLVDWKISNIITGEYYCAYIENMVRQTLNNVICQLGHIKDRDTRAVQNVMEALVLSGIAMSFAGNSRPASGSEHHLSHYWEMQFLFDGKKPILHGAKVGIGTIAVLRAYELLASYPIDFKDARKQAEQYSFEDWKIKMKDTYGPASDAVIALEEDILKNEIENRLNRLSKLENYWNDILKLARELPSADIVYNYLNQLGAPATPMAVGIDKKTFFDSFLVAKELRNRFGLLQILFDIGISEDIAEDVWNYFSDK